MEQELRLSIVEMQREWDKSGGSGHRGSSHGKRHHSRNRSLEQRVMDEGGNRNDSRHNSRSRSRGSKNDKKAPDNQGGMLAGFNNAEDNIHLKDVADDDQNIIPD